MRFKLSLLAIGSSLFVSAAMAANPPAGACIYALDPTAHRALQIAGAPAVTTACSAVVASNATDAFEMEGTETLSLQNHAQIGVVGGWQLNGQTIKDIISNTNVLPFVITPPTDPLAALVAPTNGIVVSASHANFDMNNKPTGNTLSPGVYCGGLTIGNTNGVAFNLNPGTYIMAGGGLTINSLAKVTGTGVTIYNTSSTGWGCTGTATPYTPITISGQSVVNLSAPTTGSLAGVLMFGKRTGCATLGACQNQINGGATATLDGALYFKSDTVTFSGANSVSGYLMVVADIVHINGNSTFGSTGNPLIATPLVLAPATTTLYGGQSQTFTVKLGATSTDDGSDDDDNNYSWSISPAVGSITSAGVYTAPASITTATTVTVNALNKTNTSQQGTATIALTPGAPPVTITLTPILKTIYQGTTQQFTAKVTGSTNTAVTWTLSPTGFGAISASGLYTAPTSILVPQTVTLTATSAADTTKKATSTLTLTPPVLVSPATVSLYAGQKQQFTAVVTNTESAGDSDDGTGVLWSISPATAGSITSAGLYTAPASITTITTVTVTATNEASSSKKGTATITLYPPLTISVTPATATVAAAGGTQAFAATVANASTTAVTWTVTGGGTIDATGLYTAPATVPSPATATVKATSVADPTKFATATVTITAPAISVTLTPPTASVSAGGGTQTFAATVINSTNQAVTWTVTGGGTIDSTGKYTAPATVPSPATATVKATSVADPTKFATAAVTITAPVISVTVSPLSASVSASGGSQTFAATVINSTNQAVTWTVTGGGSIDSSGKYTAPATVPSPATATVKATSVADPTKFATATVTITPPVISVSITPATASVVTGGTQTFTAAVANSTNQTVTWTASAGTIDSTGKYTAPATVPSPATVTVTATSAADPTKSASATVTITPSPVQVTVSPATVSLNANGGKQTFAATVTGTTNQSVTWAASAGTIDSTGKYTPPATVPTPATVTITATSAADTTKTGTATVTITAPISVTVTPATVSLSANGGTQTFAATVTGTTNQSVTWTASAGTIDSTGKYTAPATVPTPATVTITATSAADTTKTGTATVTITAPISVTVSPATVSLSANGGTQTFAATVTGTTNQSVTWTASAGTIDSTGKYTAPATVPTPATVTITATSAADTTKTGTATVTITAPISVTVSPATVSLSANGGTQTFAATVTGTTNQSVTWTASAGTIDSTGKYTAPATVPTPATVTITATSAADTTKTGTATVTITAPISVTVSPATVSLSANGGTQTFAATVTGTTNQSVTWTASAGTIDSTGKYTAPATVPTPATVTITATSAADTTKNGTATVTITAPISVTVTPATVSLSANGGTQTFAATVTGTTNQSVTWTASAGTIDSTGKYTAPATVPTPAIVTITATSAADTTKTGTATVTITAPISVTVTPATVSLNANGGTQTFAATVTGTTNQSVTWTASAGTIDSTGKYTAPATVPTPATVTITATSAADTTKTGTATVTITAPISVTVSPATVSLSANGGTQTFTAAVTGTTNQSVTWTASAGTIDSTGKYTAPATVPTPATVTITATSAADTTKTGTATVTITAPISVTVSPATVSLSANGGTQTFTAAVTGTTNQSVTWTASAGTIDSTGKYTAPATVPTPATVTITATSAADTTKTGTATVTITAPISVTVTPATVSLNANGGTQTFAATVTGTTNQSVTWTASAGTIDSTGKYTAPATVPTPATVTITATSAADTTKTGTATVTITAPISVTVSPATVSLSANGGTQTFAATVTGTTNQSVTWTASAGTIDSTGKYTAPATVPTPATVTITATSAADTTKTGTATVTITAPISVTVTPATVSLSANGGTQTFTAAVTGTTNQSVTWTASAGTIDSTGKYTAPATVPTPATVTITATSAADTTKTGTATVTITAPISVTVTPATVSLSANGGTQTFAATVTGTTNQSVTWTASAGTIDSTGKYTAPATVPTPATVTITATSAADTTKTGTATVTITAPISVTVSPATVSLSANGGTQTFTAAVTGTTNQSVTWTASAGTIDSTGKYTAPATVPTPATVTITATSAADTTKTGTATVTITAPISVTVTPATVSLNANGGTQTFAATVTGTTNQSVTWTASAGTIDSTGKYTAPATVPTPATVTITATSAADTTKSATATVTITAPISVTITPPTTTSLNANGGTVTLAATVTGTTNQSVTWTATAGAIDSTGKYTAPATVPTPATVTITATSVADPTKTATTTITILPAISVTITPPTTTSVNANGGTLTFAASVANTSSQAVTWSVPTGQGTIDPNTGVYTAPTTVPTPATVTITATSVADPTKTATTTITIIPAISVTVSPATVSVNVGTGTQIFTATVANTTNQTVTWSVPTGQGTIDAATGKYTAPATLPTSPTVTITATSAADTTKTGTATITLVQPLTISPSTVTVNYGQTQQFTPSLTPVTWSLSPATGAGTISTTGLYTAPTTPAFNAQVVTVTATSTTDSTKSATATINLPLVPAVSPGTSTLAAGATQQFLSNLPSVTWTASVGSVSATGLYTAPPCVTQAQTVTITATSTTDATKTATAAISLQAGTAFSYQRPIVINHYKVPNTDQTNFPVLISVTDPAFATTANGGHVTSANGYDLVFAGDAACSTRLNSEIESWNPATGQLTAWVQLPLVSHTSDTQFYACYGNSSITSKQGTSSATWDANFSAVMHLSGSASVLSVTDSTSNSNNGTIYRTPALSTGLVGNGATFDGNSYISIPQNAFTFPSGNLTFETWFKTAATGAILGQFGGPANQVQAGAPNGWVPALYLDSSGYLRASLFFHGSGTQTVSTKAYNDNQWHHVAGTFNNGTETLYVDGVAVSTSTGLSQNGYGTGSYSYTIGSAYTPTWTNGNNNWLLLTGQLDEVRTSFTARSADWIASEFANQSAPATFLTLGSENTALAVSPAVATLYAPFTQQFTATAPGCSSQTITWTVVPPTAGSINSSGLYSAPANVTTQQTVSVVATSAVDPSKSSTATVTLLPNLTVTPSTTTVNQGQALQFSFPISGATWSISPTTGAGTISSTGLYTAPAVVSSNLVVTITAVSASNSALTASTTVTVLFAPAISPTPVNVISGFTQQLTANFTPTSWTVTSGPGAVSSTGLYTAPAGLCANTPVVITAANGTQSATAAITITPSIALPTGWTNTDVGSTPTPGSASYNCGSQTFSITGQGTDVYNLPDGFNFTYQSLTGDFTVTARLVTLTNTFPYTRTGIMVRATTAPNSPYVFMEMEPNNGNQGPRQWVRQTSTQQIPDIYGAAYAAGPWVRLTRTGNTFWGYSSTDGVNWLIATFSNPQAVMPPTVLVGFPIMSNGNSTATATLDNYSAVEAPIVISLAPTTSVISAGQTQQFTPTLLNTFNQNVTWNLSGIGALSTTGLYTPPTVIATQQTVTVTATSVADPTKVATSTITLLPIPAVGPSTVTLNAGGTQQFTSPISPVTWTLNSGAPGSITAAGLYTAPLVITTPQTVTVTATSTLDPTRVATATITLWPPVNISIVPSAGLLLASQTQQFTANVQYATNTAVTWTLSGPGSLSPSGLYTAPASVATLTPVTITAASVADPTKSTSVSINVGPAGAVVITPSVSVVVPGQTQQFTAYVGAANQAVVWTLNPATGVGSIDSTGKYTAPATICAQQTVTVTATSVADSTRFGTATITVSNANGYSYQRTLTIDHTKVPNTDQNNFPILFSGTYPYLATTSNGGKVSSPNAYDVVFTSDIGCRVKLNHEIETWNPATGQFTAWVQVPLLSHSTDTNVYLCYGNPSISADQSAPKAVWDSGFTGVWHFPASTGTLTVADSTANGNNAAAIINATTATGKIGGAAYFNGNANIDFAATPSLDNYSNVTVSLWVNAVWTNPGYWNNYAALIQKGWQGSEWQFSWDPFGPYVDMHVGTVGGTNTGNAGDGNWHRVDMTADYNGVFTGYFDGVLITQRQGTPQTGSTNPIRLGMHVGDYGIPYLGLADDLKVSNVARSSDWLATEFANQNSPATFYSISAETGETLNVAPSLVSLSAGQTQQFSAALPASCGTSVTWTTSGPGTVSASGLYTAPTTIASQTTAMVTATTASGQFVTAAVTLLAGETITVTPGAVTLFSGESQQFLAAVTGAANTTVTWSNPSGLGSLTQAGVYTAPANITTLQNLTISATTADGAKTATVNVTLSPGQGVPVTETKVGHVLNIIADSLCRREHVAPVVDPGPTQSTSLVCNAQGLACQAGVGLSGSATNYTLAPGATLSYSWTFVSGPAPVTFASQTSASTSAVFTAAGNYVLQLAVNDGSVTSTATTLVIVNPQSTNGGWTLLISPATSGPNPVGTPITLNLQLAGLFTGSGSITLSITGANPITATLPANNNGLATYTYYGKNAGTDSITATGLGTCCTPTITSNAATVTWVSESPKLTSSPVTGRFYTADGSGVFNTLATATPVFTQTFPNINFNTGGTLLRPFTDYATDATGVVTGPIPAQGNNAQAGVASLYNFSAIFTGSFNVPAAGQVTFTFNSDDAFIFGIGSGTTSVSGPKTNTPTNTTFLGLPVMGGINQREAPTTSTITVNFPAPGTYAYEVDYVKGGDKNLTLTMQSGGAPITPTAVLKLVPGQSTSLLSGNIGTWNAIATDYAGAALASIPVTVNVTGLNAQTRNLTTDPTGQASVSYRGTPASVGFDQIQATALVNGVTIYSNVINVAWNTGTNTAPVVSAGTPQTVLMPAPVILTGTVTDDGLPSNTLNLTWTKLSGPGTVTFDNPNQAATAAYFSTAGSYVLQLSATDGTLTTNSTVAITANPNPNWSSGWLANPLDKSTVTQPVPVSLISGITLTSGTLQYWPVNAPQSAVTLNANTTGTGQISTFDPTLLNNGNYFIVLSATNSAGTTMTSQVYVTVAGDYKPGRVTATVTDLKVPATGLPITISRTYDSLMRNQSMDFGYGWRLGIQIQTDISPTSDVTFTINGQRRTFYFTPPANPIFQSYYLPQYTAEPGLYGSLVNTGDNCSGVLQRVGNVFQCAISNAGASYQPTGYKYTDAYGRVYTLGSDGSIQSLKDLNNNTLTVTPGGITSSTGLSVPFVRDAQGRITKITDPLLNEYNYAYDASGNLSTLTLPPSPPTVLQPVTYTYDATHLLTSEKDARGNSGTTSYYTDGKLKSITDAANQTTSYVYDIPNNKTTVTNPDGGVIVTIADFYGMPLMVTDGINRTTTYTYDANHNKLTEKNAANETTTFTYDANGFLTLKQDNLGNKWAYANNAVGGPTSVTDPNGKLTTITYDSNFNLSTVTDTIGQLAAFTYSAQGLPQTMSDGNNHTSTYSYDAYGNRTGVVDALSRSTTSLYDNLGRMSSQTDPRGNKTQYGYDALGRKTTMTDANLKVTTYGYDGNNNKISEKDPLNHTTTYTFDGVNRMTGIQYADATSKSITYDFRGNKLTEVDQLGRTTKWTYDLAGQLKSMTYAFGTADAATVNYNYDLAGRKISEQDARGFMTQYGYDNAGRMTSMTDGVGNVTQYGVDAKGQRTSMTDAKGRITNYTYDQRGRLTKTTFVDGKFITKTYDGVGKVLNVTDEENNPTNYQYDAANQLKIVTDALNQQTQYSYDLSGNKIAQTDANNHTTSYVFDALNRRTKRRLPAGQFETYAYDDAGNKTALTDFNGKTTTYGYDTLNRLTSRTPDAAFVGAPAVTFTYTSTGKRKTMVDASGTTTYSYDNRDRVTSKATPQGTLTYTFDGANNVNSVVSSNANGTNTSYSWNGVNQLLSVTDNRVGGSGVTNYTYDQLNNVATFAYSNGVTHTFGLDTRYRTTSLNVTNASASVLASYVQTFSDTGHKKTVAESTGRGENYAYDLIYRLTNETITGDPVGANNGTLGYGLDPVANRQSLTSTLAALASQSFTYDADDRLLADTYDSNGNTVSSGGLTYTYDFEDRLLSTSSGVLIVYDGDGNRVSETAAGVTTRYLVDEQTPTGYAQVAEEVVGGAVSAQFVYGKMRVSQTRGGVVSFYGYDAGGSTRQLVSGAGAVTDTYSYDAFGNTVARTGSTVNEFQYRGEQFDTALGAYYLRARYYLPKTGRFLTTDRYEGTEIGACDCSARPTHVEHPTHNALAYAGGNPVDALDPTGNADTTEFSLLSGVYNPVGSFFPIATQLGKAVTCSLAIHAALLKLAGDINNPPFSDYVALTAVVWGCLQLVP